ncbi:hypothetical protein [Anaerobranca gottschalkii]|uniref:Uncharacterized protein n=1 Tax=Anaerobranca gottschalkii DSM 13577 TaxID=1120990 RepID=A0A1I0CEP4_9FIRM|nr:hypothetical protein [Anaerobranca gottschalkii]SET17932.1 hypothetical protein SAMN03080614_10707 [Anaerobranca gottschalkii DSM 13577]
MSKKKGKKKKSPQKVSLKNFIEYVCLGCKIVEKVPKEVVEYFDMMDDGDTSIPPRFSCESCGAEMFPKTI